MKTTSLRDGATQLAGTGDGMLVDPEWLNAHLSDPRVRVVEVDVSPAAYNDWHIDGATLWNVYADLKDALPRLEADEDHTPPLSIYSAPGDLPQDPGRAA